MKQIVQASNGDMWREVETVEEALVIGKVTKTAFDLFFQGVVKAPPARYFALGDDYKVIGSVPVAADPSGRPGVGAPLFVTYMNGDPFTKYGKEIAELSQSIGVEIISDHYPYRNAIDDGGPTP